MPEDRDQSEWGLTGETGRLRHPPLWQERTKTYFPGWALKNSFSFCPATPHKRAGRILELQLSCRGEWDVKSFIMLKAASG